MKQVMKKYWVVVTLIGIILLLAVGLLVNFLIAEKQIKQAKKDFSLQNCVSAERCEEFILNVEKEYQDNLILTTKESNNDYDNFVIVTNKKCPFVSTVWTSECLDRLIIQKEKELKNLIVEVRKGAIAKKEFIIKEYDSSAMEWDNFLEYLSMHEKSWENYSNTFCGVKNSQIGGTAMSEESRKCKLFQIEQFIQLLNDQKEWVM